MAEEPAAAESPPAAETAEEDVTLPCGACRRELPLSGVGPKALKFVCIPCGVTSYMRRDSKLLKGTVYMKGA